MVTLPVMSLNQIICQEEGIDCVSEVHRVPLYYCATIGFQKEFHTLYLYSSETCSKKGILWILLLIPLLYVLSYYLHERWETSIDAWKFGLKSDLIAFLVIIATILPSFLFGIFNTRMEATPLTAYTVSPIVFLYEITHVLISGMIIPFVIILGGLILFICGIYFICKTWEIPHPLLYTIWGSYLAICILGILMA
jgi:hypothetical protein